MEKEYNGQLAKAEKTYAENTFKRALVTGIPYIGGSLDVLFSSKGKKIIEKRVSSLLAELSLETKQIEERMIDKEFLKTEEWFDIVLKGLESATKTRDHEKIRLYAKVLRGAATKHDRNQFSPEDYLSILSELTLKEIEVARAIYAQQKEGKPSSRGPIKWAQEKGWEQLGEQCPTMRQEELQFILLRLQGSGLIQEIVGTFVGYTGGVYVITDFFRNLMYFLEFGNLKR